MSQIQPHYSLYKKANNLIFTSGQLPLINGATKKNAVGIRAQTMFVLKKVEDLIAS